MSATTVTLPLKLFHSQNSADLHNQIAKSVGELTALVAERPDRVTDYAIAIERLRGQADVLEYLEESFRGIVEYGAEQGWHMTQILLAQYSVVADLALQYPDDTGGSRLNDGKRAYNDGWRSVLLHVIGDLRRSEYFPGN